MLIQIKDYQGITSAKLRLLPGINAVIGKTNAGKSSIIRAISDLVNNDITDSDVRIGSKEGKAVVAIKNDNGNLVKLTRSLNSTFKTKYDINGESIEKVGKQKLDEVDVLGLSTFEDLNIHFIKQEDLPFLVFENQYKTYEFLSQSKSQLLLNVSQGLIAENKILDKEYKSSLTEADIIKTRYDEIREELKTYPNFQSHYEVKKKLSRDIIETKNMFLIKDKIDKNESLLVEVEKNIVDLKYKVDSFGIDNLIILNEHMKSLGLCKVVSKSVSDYNLKINELDKEISEYIKIDLDTQELKRFSEDMKLFKSVANKYSDTLENLDLFEDPKVLVMDTIILDTFRRDFNLVKSLSALNNRYNKIMKELENIEKLTTELNKSIELSEKELSQYDVCPTCNRPIVN
ncbi:MAG: AAA family ATPase [Cetobacterium sp.]